MRAAHAGHPGVVGIKMKRLQEYFLLRSVVLEYPEKVVYSGFDEMLVREPFAYRRGRMHRHLERICCPIYMQRYTRARARRQAQTP